MMLTLKRLNFFLLASALLLSACAPNRARPDLVFVNGAEPETVDPALVTDQVSMRVSTALFEGLCRNTAAGKPEPGVAKRWEVSADKKTYTFHLRSNAVWSNGEPLTASDFIYSWRRVLEPSTAADYASQLFIIRGAREFNEGKNTDFGAVGVRAVDPSTLEVALENPTPFFIDLCAVAMETIDVMPVSDPNTALNYFLTGQVDLMMDKGTVPVSLVSKLKQQPWFHTGPFLGTWFIRFNVTKPPFNDSRVRHALSLAIDRKRITEKITQLGEISAFSLVPPGAGANYQPPRGDEFDPVKARELLALAGYPEGKGFPLIEYLHIPPLVERNIAVELQAMWEKNLGIKVGLAKQEQKIWLSSMRELSYQFTRSSWVGDYNDPNTFLEMFTSTSGNNRTGWKNAVYDQLIAEASSEADVAERNEIFYRAEKLLVADEAVILPVYFYVGVQFFHADKLGGVETNLIDDHPFRCMHWKK